MSGGRAPTLTTSRGTNSQLTGCETLLAAPNIQNWGESMPSSATLALTAAEAMRGLDVFLPGELAKF